MINRVLIEGQDVLLLCMMFVIDDPVVKIVRVMGRSGLHSGVVLEILIAFEEHVA